MTRIERLYSEAITEYNFSDAAKRKLLVDCLKNNISRYTKIIENNGNDFDLLENMQDNITASKMVLKEIETSN